MKAQIQSWCGFIFVFALLAAPTVLRAQSPDLGWNVAVLDQILAGVPPGQTHAQIGDMDYPVSVLQAWRNHLAGGPEPLFAVGTNVTLWPGGNVYYIFSNNVNATKQKAFVDAATEWTLFANVHFMPRAAQANYVFVYENPALGGGLATVGMAGGQQFIQIGPTAWNRRTLSHEMGHSLGLVHEHQRSDRDSFITIISNNIASGQEANFVLLPTATNHGAYDFLSIMHYAHNAFSTDPNTLDTMVPLPAFTNFYNVMGDGDPVLSLSDRTNMAVLYGAAAVPLTNVVTNTQDNGAGSLRAALYYGFDHPGTTITFNIPTNDPGFTNGVFTIQPDDQFPSLLHATTINGSSEPAQLNPGGPAIQINGALASLLSPGANGLHFGGTNSAARGLIINGFPQSGVAMDGSNTTGNTVSGCFLGIDSSGSLAVTNLLYPVFLSAGAHGNTIGGTTIAARNVISGGAFQGVLISDAGTSGNVVAGNFIGLNAAGTAALPNGFEGVGIYNGAQSNLVGGTAPGAGNVISGNTFQGVVMNQGSTGNLVEGNFIGLDPVGTNAIPNHAAGVQTANSSTGNIIGGTAPGAGNVISGNSSQGVLLATSSNVVMGNFIGLNAAGAAAVPNGGAGVNIAVGTLGNIVGGTAAGAANVISGNTGQGVAIAGSSSLVVGNYVGLSAAGTNSVPNSVGVNMFGGAQNNVIGGTTPAARNIISGNNSSQVSLQSAGTDFNLVEGNYIGTTASGLLAVAGTGQGVILSSGASSNTIGGTAPGARNVISGNATLGINVQGVGTMGNLIEGNTIGLDALGSNAIPNSFGGIEVFSGAVGTQIGGPAIGAANLISGNTTVGVFISDSTTSNNTVRGNSISGNGTTGQFGIAVQSSGNHNLVNPPAISSAVVGASNTTVIGSLSSFPASTIFHVDYYVSPGTADTAQARDYLGSQDVTTSGAGSVNFTNASVALLPLGQFITATATDPAGNTSTESFSGTAVTGTSTVGDGIPDAWRAAHFGGSGTTTNSTNCAACDADHDGESNLAEFLAGTNPTNAASVLKAGTVAASGADMVLTFQTVPGVVYRVYERDDVALGTWAIMADQIVGAGGSLQVTDPGAASLPKRFYRLQVFP